VAARARCATYVHCCFVMRAPIHKKSPPLPC
jgi:hypothetical protein